MRLTTAGSLWATAEIELAAHRVEIALLELITSIPDVDVLESSSLGE